MSIEVFPPAKGTDWSEYSHSYTNASSDSSTASDVVNITGKGYLMNIRQIAKANSNGSFNTLIEVIVDGTTLGEVNLSYATASHMGIASISPLIRFESSLVVKHRSNVDFRNYETFVEYALD